MRSIKILLLAFLASFLIAPAASLTAEEAGNLLGNSSQGIKEMEDAGIPTSRVNNLLDEANRSYQAQLALESQGSEPDFNRVEQLTSDIQEIRENAFRAKDEIEVLELELNSTGGVNKTGAERQLALAKTDYNNQRFSDAIQHVDNSYRELSEAQAVSTQVQAFLDSQQEGIENYVRRNARMLVLVSVTLFVLFLSLLNEYRAIKLFFRKKKFEHRDAVAENSLKNLDERYFRKNDISKEVYELRRDKYQSIRNESETKVPEIVSRLEESKNISSLILSLRGELGSEDEDQDLDDARDKLGKINEEKEELEERRKELEEKHDEGEMEYEDFSESLEDIKEKKEVLEDRIAELKDKLA